MNYQRPAVLREILIAFSKYVDPLMPTLGLFNSKALETRIKIRLIKEEGATLLTLRHINY